MALGQCRECLRRRETRPVSRSGGGSYRRGGRSYRSSICAECAEDLLSRLTPGTTTARRWDISGLMHAFPEIKTESARQWRADLDARIARSRARREGREHMHAIETVRRAVASLRTEETIQDSLTSNLLETLVNRAEELVDSMPPSEETRASVLAHHLIGWEDAVALAQRIVSA